MVVVVTDSKDYRKQMGKSVIQMKPSVCLECIAGQTTGEMLEYLGFGSTLILYGLLSD